MKQKLKDDISPTFLLVKSQNQKCQFQKFLWPAIGRRKGLRSSWRKENLVVGEGLFKASFLGDRSLFSLNSLSSSSFSFFRAFVPRDRGVDRHALSNAFA